MPNVASTDSLVSVKDNATLWIVNLFQISHQSKKNLSHTIYIALFPVHHPGENFSCFEVQRK